MIASFCLKIRTIVSYLIIIHAILLLALARSRDKSSVHQEIICPFIECLDYPTTTHSRVTKGGDSLSTFLLQLAFGSSTHFWPWKRILSPFAPTMLKAPPIPGVPTELFN